MPHLAKILAPLMLSGVPLTAMAHPGHVTPVGGHDHLAIGAGILALLIGGLFWIARARAKVKNSG